MRKNAMRLTLCAMLFALCFSAEAQQPKKVPRIGYNPRVVPERTTRRHFARDCVNWATSKGRTSSLSGDLWKESPIRSDEMQLSWSG